MNILVKIGYLILCYATGVATLVAELSEHLRTRMQDSIGLALLACPLVALILAACYLHKDPGTVRFGLVGLAFSYAIMIALPAIGNT